MNLSKISISGSSSGLGCYIHNNIWTDFKVYKYDRTTNVAQSNDIFLHCAWDTKFKSTGIDYINNHLNTIDLIHRVPQKKFIFISSIDVYPKDKEVHCEEEKIDDRNIGIYGLTKYLIEEKIKYLYPGDKHLILRCGYLLGQYSNNSITKWYRSQPVNLSHKSTFNVVTYEIVLEFIKRALKNNWYGTYNIVAKDRIKLGLVKNRGAFKYKTPIISDTRLSTKAPDLSKTSNENITDWREAWLRNES